MQPLVSIITPTYNRGHLIGETLDSVIAQTYQNWECIVVDDGSLDYVNELLQFYCEKDSRIHYHQRPKALPKGANACRNYGFKLSKGEYIQWLDSDDLLSKNKLEEQLRMLQLVGGDIATCCWGSFGNSANLNVKQKYHSFKNFEQPIQLLRTFGEYNEYFPSHVYLTSRNLIKNAGNWNEKLLINQDGEFFTRIIINASKIVFCSSTAAYYRYGSKDRTSVLNNKKKIIALIESWKLIENHLKDRYEKIASVYVRNGKKIIYEEVKKTNPEILSNHKEFFDDISPIKNWFGRLISR